MLLSALGFWEMGQIALIAAYTALIGAILMLILSVLGVAHLRRVAPEAEVFPAIGTGVEVSQPERAATAVRLHFEPLPPPGPPPGGSWLRRLDRPADGRSDDPTAGDLRP